MRFREDSKDRNTGHRNRRRAGQSASELAVFGAILLFVIGLIARTALSNSQQMNAQLRALRTAMFQSWKTSKGNYSPASIDDPIARAAAGRNSANVIFIEDRLMTDGDKFGSQDRFPLMSGGSATYSTTLFMTTDWLEYWNLPMVDLVVNGVWFPLHAANFKELRGPRLGGLPPCRNTLTGGVGGACWADPCFTDRNGDDKPCAVFFKIVVNHPLNEEYRINTPWRFDLNLDGQWPDVPPSEFATFGWQWLRVAAVDDDVIPEGCDAVRLDEPWEVRGMDTGHPEGGNETDTPLNLIVEIDQDLKEESILTIQRDGFGAVTRVRAIDYQDGDIDLTYTDYDRERRGIPEPGIQQGGEISSKVNPETQLQIEEAADFYESRQELHLDERIERQFRLSNDMNIYVGDSDGNIVETRKKWCDGTSPVAWDNDFPPGMRGFRNPFRGGGQRCHTSCGCTGFREPPDPLTATPAQIAAYNAYVARCFRNGGFLNTASPTCFQIGGHPLIFIRSEIPNEMGHIWNIQR